MMIASHLGEDVLSSVVAAGAGTASVLLSRCVPTSRRWPT
jgi:hypothetical protein